MNGPRGDARPLTVAVPSGALLDGSLTLLRRAGVVDLDPGELGRGLMVTTASGTRLIMVRPTDVPVYVDSGTADLGIVGKDSLWEAPGDRYELADLEFGRCRLVVAAPRESAITDAAGWPATLRVGTKYPLRAARFFAARGQLVQLIKLHGSVELAPRVGLVDVIVDITASGRSLVENDLREVCEIEVSTARLVANQASLKTRAAAVQQLTADLRRAAGSEA